MKNLTLSAAGQKARDGFCRGGSSASSSGASSTCYCSCDDCGGGRNATATTAAAVGFASFDLAAAKRASVNKLARLLGEEVRCDDKVLFDHCTASRGRRNAFANIFCGLPSKGLRRLFAIYGIDEVQTKAPREALDLGEEARQTRAAHRRRQQRQPENGFVVDAGRVLPVLEDHSSKRQQKQPQPRQQHHQHHRHRPHSAMDPSRKRILPAFAAA